MAAFWQQGRPQKVSVILLVHISLLWVTITAKLSFSNTIFDLIYKYVIYIIQFLTRLASLGGIQRRH